MSLETLNRIFGEAIINASFCRALLADPGAAVQDYELGSEELELLSSIRAGSVDNLAQQIIAGLDPECGILARSPDLGGRTCGASGGGYVQVRSPVQPSKAAAQPTVFGKARAVPSTC
jgi:hypothetical protein